jgi:hypothetical protein
MLLVLPLWNGDRQGGERIMRDLQALGASQLAQVGPMTYSDMLGLFDASLDAADGCHWETRTRSLPAPLAPSAVEAIITAVDRKTSPYSMINWHHFHGASTRLAADATAFGLRDEHFMVEIVAGWKPDGDNGAEPGATHRQWAQDVWERLAPLALRASYASFLATSDREQAKDAYGKNGDRLRALKRRFDPDGVFASTIPLPD